MKRPVKYFVPTLRLCLDFALVILLACQLGNALHGQGAERTVDIKRVIVRLSELPGLRGCWSRAEFEGPPRFDVSGQFLCLTAHTWATNADFSQALHYVILSVEGVVQASSEEVNPDANLLARFPDLATRLSHRALVSRDDYTNMFLDQDRWVVAPDLSWCARVRQTSDSSDLIEKFNLNPQVEKQWTWNCKGAYGPPSCRISFVKFPSREVIALSCSFGETALLDARTGTTIDRVPYGPGSGMVSNTAIATCVIPKSGWLICGEYESKRIRVISLNPPHGIVREVGPKGVNGLGVWSTFRLEATADGQFLLKVSDWGSRLMGGKTETEIYDTDTWKVLWRDVDRHGGDVTLSPDGRRLAIRKGQELEIRRFPSEMRKQEERRD